MLLPSGAWEPEQAEGNRQIAVARMSTSELKKVHGWFFSRKPSSSDGIRVQENLVDSLTEAVLMSLLPQWAKAIMISLVFGPYYK